MASNEKCSGERRGRMLTELRLPVDVSGDRTTLGAIISPKPR